MENIKVKIEKTAIDMSAYDALMASVKDAVENAKKTEETVIPRIIAEGKAKYEAIMEQCAELAEKANELYKYKDVVGWDYICLTYYREIEFYFRLECHGTHYEITFNNRPVRFSEELATDRGSWLVNWNEYGVLGELMKNLNDYADCLVRTAKEKADRIIDTEKRMLY